MFSDQEIEVVLNPGMAEERRERPTLNTVLQAFIGVRNLPTDGRHGIINFIYEVKDEKEIKLCTTISTCTPSITFGSVVDLNSSEIMQEHMLRIIYMSGGFHRI